MHVHDAEGSFDPTGTKKIRDSFKRDFQKRWQNLEKLTDQAITKNDIVGLSVQSIAHAAHSGGDLIKNFQSWFDQALNQIVLGNNGSWMFGYFNKAQTLATSYSQRETSGPDYGGTFKAAPLIRSSAVVELQGIMEVVSQQAVRAIAHGLLTKQRPARIVRHIREIVRSIGRFRSFGLVDYMIVKMFNETTLDVFENSGVKSVGIIPEFVPQQRSSPVALTDAAKTPRSFSKRSSIFKRGFKSRAQFQEVDVLTAGDKLVCQVCKDAAAKGPYTIAEARGLVPLHIGCRCGLVPAGDLPLFDPSQVPAKNRPSYV